MARPTVAVIFGGRSVEHEVSVITAHQVMAALEAAGFPLLPVYVTKDGRWYAGGPLHDLRAFTDPRLPVLQARGVYRVSLCADRSVRGLVLHPDAGSGLLRRPPRLWADVFFPAIHGTFGEDGTLQGLLEMADVPFVGSGVLASALGMDKARMKALCRDAGIPVLDCLVISRPQWEAGEAAVLASVEAACGYPAMVKPVTLGSSIGVRRCTRPGELTEAIATALELDERVLIEQALTEFIEINCAVLGGGDAPERTSVCEQPVHSSALLSFDDKYRRGAKGKSAGAKGMASLARLIPAPIDQALTAQVQDLARRVFRLIGAAGVARADFLYETAARRLYFNEINTMPGSAAFYLWEASGLPFDELVTELVRIAQQRHAARSRTRFAFDSHLLQAR